MPVGVAFLSGLLLQPDNIIKEKLQVKRTNRIFLTNLTCFLKRLYYKINHIIKVILQRHCLCCSYHLTD